MSKQALLSESIAEKLKQNKWQLADSDNTSSSQYKLQCERGHQFVGSATYIKSNKLCKICKKIKNIEDRIKLAKPLLSKLGQKIIEVIPKKQPSKNLL